MSPEWMYVAGVATVPLLILGRILVSHLLGWLVSLLLRRGSGADQ